MTVKSAVLTNHAYLRIGLEEGLKLRGSFNEFKRVPTSAALLRRQQHSSYLRLCREKWTEKVASGSEHANDDGTVQLTFGRCEAVLVSREEAAKGRRLIPPSSAKGG